MTLLPALAILLLSLFRVNIRLTLLAGIASAMAVCLLYQVTELLPLLRLMLLGYRAPDPRAAGMLNGGGIVSMLRVAAIAGSGWLPSPAPFPWPPSPRRPYAFGGHAKFRIPFSEKRCYNIRTV